MQANFIKVDLHIHTPASKSCYKLSGVDYDTEFFDILFRAKEQNIKLISFTDHNSIQGYKHLINIKSKLLNQKNSLEQITDSEQSKKLLKQNKLLLDLLDDVRVLPGIEFEVNNCIHLLIIFSEDTQIEQIEQFLSDGGYSSDNYGLERPNILSKWDIFSFFEASKKYKCIIIDAHSDSDKGILKTIPPGTAKAACFSSPQLNAISCSNEKERNKLSIALDTSKEYSRQYPLTFVNFSDAHSSDKVGAQVTWIKMETPSFENLKFALLNPSEMVSTEEPSLVKILDRLKKSDNSLCVADYDTPLIQKLICGLTNTKGGHVLIGIEDNKKFHPGIHYINERLTPQKENFDQIVEGIENLPRISITTYPMQNEKAVFSLRIQKSDNLIGIKGDSTVYSIDKNKLNKLSVNQVQKLIEDRTLKSLEPKVSTKLKSVEKECSLIKHIFTSVPIMRKFESNSIKTSFRIEAREPIELNNELINKLDDPLYTNGYSRGNLLFAKGILPPRLQYGFLRYSPPLFFLRTKLDIIEKETIYVLPGGAVFYSKRDYPFFSQNCPVVLVLHDEPSNAPYGMPFTTCFFKSSFLYWYVLNKFNSSDYASNDIITNINFPKINTHLPENIKMLEELKIDFNKILYYEKKYLIEYRKLKTDEEITKMTESHNSIIDPLAGNIDNIIFNLVGVSSSDINVIGDYLRLNSVYPYFKINS
jgi:PHP family Zn ribbon phosphoesterase